MSVEQTADATLDVLDRTFVECSALGFQSVLTSILAIACYLLWRRQRHPYFLTWSAAWAVYVVRLACMSTFLVRRDMVWLFLHQSATGISALLLLLAALQLSRGLVLRPYHALLVPLSIAWAWFTIYGIGSMMVAGITATLLLSGVTIATGVIFWRERARISSGAAPVLAGAFILWGLHHLDYPLLRGFGAAVLYGVFADVLFLFAIGLGLLFVVLGDERDRLAARTEELEHLSRLLIRVQEDERRRIARELHDEAGQVLTAVKIELELDGRMEAGALVGRALAQVRDVSNLLRPSALDDLGLVAALRALVDDFALRTRIDVSLDLDGVTRPADPEVEVAVYRVIQEALTNVAKHAQATEARVRVQGSAGALSVVVDDNGVGAAEAATSHLGWLGMRERVTALGGRLDIERAPAGGVRIAATIPAGAAA
jgi:signal transduction histidine kinase